MYVLATFRAVNVFPSLCLERLISSFMFVLFFLFTTNFITNVLSGSDVIICLFSHRNCGIEDPSWAELRYFVNFLNSQLQACEESSFCDMDLVGDTLEGFRSFVVRFMILMSRVRVAINLISNSHRYIY